MFYSMPQPKIFLNKIQKSNDSFVIPECWEELQDDICRIGEGAHHLPSDLELTSREYHHIDMHGDGEQSLLQTTNPVLLYRLGSSWETLCK